MHSHSGPNPFAVINFSCGEIVLAASIQSASRFATVLQRIPSPDAFPDPSHRLIFSAMKAAWDANPVLEREGWDVGEILEAIRVRKTSDEWGPHAREFASLGSISELAFAHFEDDHDMPWKHCVESLRENHIRANADKLGRVALEQLRSKNSDAASAMRAALAALIDDEEKKRVILTGTQAVLASIEAVNSKKSRRYLMGVEVIDDGIGGFANGSLNVIAARPGMGKTTLAIHIFRRFALAGGSSSFFSLEMTFEEVGAILLCQQAGISHNRVIRGEMTEIDISRGLDAAAILNDRSMRVIAESGMTLESFCEAATAEVENGSRLIVLDYLQLLGTSRAFKSRYEQVAHISARLKQLALKLKVPILALCQLNREIEKERKKRWPHMADLRESGTIEQDADTVSFLCFDPKEPPPPDEAEFVRPRFVIAKNRNGKTAIVAYEWDKPKRRIFEKRDMWGDSR